MDILSTLVALVILVFSAILHEIAHGYVAERLGDPTARLAGRLTLNPRSHIDLFYTILMPLFTFMATGGHVIMGGAKPVPIDPFNLREGRKDIALVSLAGPLTNILLALLASAIIRLLLPFISVNLTVASFVHGLLVLVAQINLLLAIFNLLPIPPLDGSKIVALLLPERDANAYLSLSSIGLYILVFLLFFPIGGFSLSGMLFSIYSLVQNILIP